MFFVLVSWSCQQKMPQTRWQLQRFIASRFQRLGVQNQGVTRATLPLEPVRSFFCLFLASHGGQQCKVLLGLELWCLSLCSCRHMTFFPSVSVPSLQGPQSSHFKQCCIIITKTLKIRIPFNGETQWNPENCMTLHANKWTGNEIPITSQLFYIMLTWTT